MALETASVPGLASRSANCIARLARESTFEENQQASWRLLFSAMLVVPLASAIALVPTTVRADAPRTESVKCSLVEAASHPGFTQSSPRRSEEDLRACAKRETAGSSPH